MAQEKSLELDAYISPFTPEVQEMVRKARRLILTIMPDTIEQFDPSIPMIAYGFDLTYKGLICSITIFKTYINIMLAQGASLNDPQGLLKGTGKLARHIRVNASVDLEEPGVKELLKAAFEKKLSEQH